MATVGRQRVLEGGAHPPQPPASPDDVESAALKYKKRRRRLSATSIARNARLGASAAAWVALGVVLGLLLAAVGNRLLGRLTGSRVPASLPQHSGGEQQAPGQHEQQQLGRRGMMQEQLASTQQQKQQHKQQGWQLQDGLPTSSARTNCTVSLAEADRELLRREMSLLSRSLCDGRPWQRRQPDAAPAQAGADVVAAGQTLEVLGTAVPGVVDQAYGQQTGANVPGVQDIHAELQAYNQALVAGRTTDVAEAAARQLHPLAADLGLVPLDWLNDTDSLPQRITFLNELNEQVQAGESLRVCITATVSADVRGLRRDLLPWLQYHTELGASHFYLLYDGTDAEAVRLLGTIRHVTLMHIHPPWASPAELERVQWYAAGAGEAASATRHWAGQPGNFNLMVKQGYGLGEALRRAEEDGLHWLLHLDPDELFHPGGPAFSLTAVLAQQPAHVPAVRFMNFEGQPEAGDVSNRIEQVTLFRVHKHFITPEAHFYRQKYKLGDSAAFLMLYANGKSAVRVDAPGVRHLGPHFFTGSPSFRWQTEDNPTGAWRDVVSDDSVVLHYAYSYEQDVSAKAHRSCPDVYLEAARRGDRAKVKECFVIDFDTDAYMAAAQGPSAARDFFFSRMVLSEGSHVRCADPQRPWQQGWCTLTDVERFKFLMTKLGLYRRLHGPQMLLRQHERQIQRRLQQQEAVGGGLGATAEQAQAGGATEGTAEVAQAAQ